LTGFAGVPDFARNHRRFDRFPFDTIAHAAS